MRLLLLAAALALASACRTTETRGPASSPNPTVRVGRHARTWEVRSEGEVVGLVVLFQERGLARDCVYVVKNPWRQDVGLIDGLGRAFRYVPHLEDPAWVGSGTIAQGAERILGASGPCELVDDGSCEDSGSPTPFRDDVVPAGAPRGAPTPSCGPVPGVGLPQSAPGDLSKD